MARAGEPTFEPSARRLAEARRRGDVAVSARLTSAAALAAAVVALALDGPAVVARLQAYLRAALAAAVAGQTGAASALADGLAVMARALAAPVGAAAAAALAVALAQTRGLVVLAPLGPDPGRLVPGAGGRGGRPWAARAAGEAGQALVELAVLGSVAFALLRGVPRLLARAAGAPAPRVLGLAAALTLGLAGALAAAALALGALDLWLRWLRHRRGLRMTREELRREIRETEGDPARRAERRRLHRDI